MPRKYIGDRGLESWFNSRFSIDQATPPKHPAERPKSIIRSAPPFPHLTMPIALDMTPIRTAPISPTARGWLATHSRLRCCRSEISLNPMWLAPFFPGRHRRRQFCRRGSRPDRAVCGSGYQVVFLSELRGGVAKYSIPCPAAAPSAAHPKAPTDPIPAVTPMTAATQVAVTAASKR